MGFLKKIKKAVKKTISNPVNVVKQVAKGDVKGALETAVKGPVNDVKDSLDIAKSIAQGAAKAVGIKTAANVEAPAPNNAAISAAQVANPEEDKGEVDDGGDSASEIKKSKATGKKALTVARTSGGGVNI